jgi:hypothetical protein
MIDDRILEHHVRISRTLTSGLLLNRTCVLLDITSGLFLNRTYTHHVTYVATQQPTNIYQSAHAHDRETREKQERETRDQEIKRYKAYIYIDR